MSRLRNGLQARPAAKKIKSYFRRGAGQVTTSVIVGLTGMIIAFTTKGASESALLTFGNYFAFLIGIAAVTILANSVMTAFLLYIFQSVKSDQAYYYDRFRESASALREQMGRLRDDGVISSESEDLYQDVELLTLEDLPLAYNETVTPFIEELLNEVRDHCKSDAEFNRIMRDIAVKALILEEAANGLGVNLIKRVVMKVWVSPVIKSFRTLTVTMIAILIGAIHFSGITANILVGLALGVGCMTILLMGEIGSLAVQESREFFEHDRDADHPANNSEDDSPHRQGTDS